MQSRYFFIVIALTFLGCSENEEPKSCNSPKIHRSSDPNPNGSSELALLMRSVFEETEAMKIQIEGGKLDFNQEYIDNIKKFHSAIPTKEDMKPSTFDGFAKGLEISAEKLINSNEEDVKNNFNSLVNSCIACHEVACPGPLVKINKLPIQ